MRLGVRMTFAALALFVASCGGGAPGFFVDNVTLAPDDVPFGSQSTELLRIGADVNDDMHTVTAVWAQAENAPLWMDMTLGTAPRWSASIPVSQLDGLAAGTYRIDLHAEDDAGRSIVLTDAVRLKISLQ